MRADSAGIHEYNAAVVVGPHAAVHRALSAHDGGLEITSRRVTSSRATFPLHITPISFWRFVNTPVRSCRQVFTSPTVADTGILTTNELPDHFTTSATLCSQAANSPPFGSADAAFRSFATVSRQLLAPSVTVLDPSQADSNDDDGGGDNGIDAAQAALSESWWLLLLSLALDCSARC